MIDPIRTDLQYGWRQLRRAPAFRPIASAALTIGIALAVGAFSFSNATRLPEAAPEGVYRDYTSDGRGRHEPNSGSSSADYLELTRYGPFAHLPGLTNAANASSTRRACHPVGSRGG